MDFFPKRFPLFGGQRIDVFIKDDETNSFSQIFENSSHLYMELLGTVTNHCMNLTKERKNFYCYIPANDMIENKDVRIYMACEENDKKNVKTIFEGSKIEFFNDRIQEYSNLILTNIHDDNNLSKYLKELHVFSSNLINNDQSLENFDIKLATILHNKLTANIEEYWKENVSQTSWQTLLKILDRNCLLYTRDIFNKFFKHEKLEPPDENFVFDINPENALKMFGDVIFLKQLSNEGLFYISHTIYMENFSIDEKISTLKDFIREYSESETLINSKELSPCNQKSRSKSMNRYSPSNIETDPKNNKCEVNKINRNMDDINLRETSIFCEMNMQRSKRNTLMPFEIERYEKGPLPSRSASDKRTMNKNLSFENLNSYFTPESGISLELSTESPLQSQHQGMKGFLSASTSPENLHLIDDKPLFDQNDTVQATPHDDSDKSEEIICNINEFIQKQYEQVSKDTSFIINQKSSAANSKEQQKKRFKGISQLFKKDKKNAKKRDSSVANMPISVNKSICSSSMDVKSASLPNRNNNTLISPSPSEHSISVTEKNENNQEEFFPEAETWSEITDPKVLKKLNTKEIRKQDVIFETIKTEYFYLKTLKTMYNIYYKGLLKELKIPQEKVDILIPRITDLSAIHGTILATWRQLQNRSENMIVDAIGDSFIFQFSDVMGKKITEVYGFICSNQNEANETYNEIMNEKKVRDFMESCRKIKYLRRLSLKECQTLIAQRMVKYPIFIERMLDNTKESDKDYEKLKLALKISKEVVKNINTTVTHIMNQKTLTSYQQRADSKSEYINKNGDKVKLIDLLTDVNLKSSTSARFKHKLKLYDIILACTNKYLLILVEKDLKISLFAIEKKVPIIIYRNSMIRISAADTKSLFLLDQKNTDFYEICFITDKDCTSWVNHFNELRSEDVLINHEIDKNISLNDQKDFINLLNNVSKEIEEIYKIFKNIIQQLHNIYEFLLKKVNKKEEKKLLSRFSIVDDSWWEKTIISDLQNILKIISPVDKNSNNNTNTVSNYRSRTKTINTPPSSSPTPGNLTRGDSASRFNTKQKLKEQNTICTQVQEILLDISKEENFLKLIKNKLSIIDPKIKMVFYVDKTLHELSNDNNVLLIKIQEFKISLQDILKKYQSDIDIIDKDMKFIFQERMGSIKKKVEEMSQNHK